MERSDAGEALVRATRGRETEELVSVFKTWSFS